MPGRCTHLLLPRENGKAVDRHAVTRYINKAAATAGLPHIHPHQLRHTLATQAKVRGIAFDATSDADGDCLSARERLFRPAIAA